MDEPLDLDALEASLARRGASRIPLVRIVDDEEQVRKSLAMLLRSEGFECEAWPSASEYLESGRGPRPGCLVLDIRMPGMSGLQLHSRLISLSDSLPIVFLSGHGTLPVAVDALKKGAVDFIEKPFDPDTLLEAVHRAVGKSIRQLDEDDPLEEALGRFRELSDRERQVFHDVAGGLGNKAIAEHLGISARTVEIYKSAALRKLHIRQTAEAARLIAILKAAGAAA